ncbi:GNAT family N-acetyltransferase [Nocardioides sp. KC13]|uniref:GNAT family N-acetyltransferase n=2 Tax=Nocardioides turkmenicus TaxID=2711220 RepID=A0A6M1RD43_9ACTN|nr:GNAT family N-acetyltransferase [Nocardioides sp. KC13]
MRGQRPGPMDADYEDLVASAETWVVTDGTDDIKGFVVLLPSPDDFVLDNIAVRPENQGQGYGRHLLALAEARANAVGAKAIRLYTHETMVENQRLYGRIGYVETSRRDDRGFGRVFFEKTLTS